MADLKYTDVFNRIWEAYHIGDKLIILQGGQGSSKTFSVLQFLAAVAKGYPGKRITIASYALPHLKSGAMPDFDKILIDMGLITTVFKNRSDNTYHFPGGSIVEFYGIEGNVAKAHGPRRDILFINECNRKITYEVFDQLNTRTQECTFLDFNPDRAFWLHDNVIPNFPHTLIKSNFTDNPYLPERERDNILMKKDKPGFENWWTVYGKGELGTLEGAIISNWRYGEFDITLPYGFGLDFGYNDPDAMVKVAIDEKNMRMYWDEKIYKGGNSFEDLRQIMNGHCTRNDLIVADAADARMIAQLRKYFNIRPVNKAKFTVQEALKMMQAYEHVITPESHNLAREFVNYIWSDSKAGIPIDDFNHLIDAGRYRFMDSVTRTKGIQTWRG
jgi:phage terminase large subunit